MNAVQAPRLRAVVQRVAAARRRAASAASRATERGAVAAGGSLSALSRRLLLTPHRNEHIPSPEPLTIDGIVFDVVADLVEYTGLPRERVLELIDRRPESFRTEWHGFPASLRTDHWFYLSSRSYLFANAVHFHEAPELIDEIACACRGSRALDFGGGAGNLSLALAARGLEVDYLELSALQKDFTRFRVQKHGLGDRVKIRDAWEPLPPREYDLIVALDVLEHLPELARTLEGSVLPSLRSGGALAEQSPFVRDVSNPMHHEDEVGLAAFLTARGLQLVEASARCRIWRLG